MAPPLFCLSPRSRPGAFRLTLLAGLLVASLLVACTAPRRSLSPRPPAAGRLPVVTTVLPVTLFTRAVAGDCAEVRPLIPAASGPHDFQARPDDLRALSQARVLVSNGLGMEAFLDGLVASAENRNLLLIDSSRAVATLATDRHPEGSHHHGALHGQPHGEPHGAPHGEANPHIWLDPLRAVQQVNTIRDGLIRADPGCAAGYRRRAAAYTAALRQLDQEIGSRLQPFHGRSFVAFHAVAPYFAERYGLRVVHLVGAPELNPTPADLQRVAAEVRRSRLRALLTEPQQGGDAFQALARDLGVRLAVFDPLETASEQAAADPRTYLTVMRRNSLALRQAFAP